MKNWMDLHGSAGLTRALCRITKPAGSILPAPRDTTLFVTVVALEQVRALISNTAKFDEPCILTLVSPKLKLMTLMCPKLTLKVDWPLMSTLCSTRILPNMSEYFRKFPNQSQGC